MSPISANDIKTRGVSVIEAALAEAPEAPEAIIAVRGKERFVVMDIAHYQHLRECELEVALSEARAEAAAGLAVRESAADHVARLQAEIAAET